MDVNLAFHNLSADQIRLVKDLAEAIEALKAKPESATTACSAAGGGIEQTKTGGSASREPCQDTIGEFVKKRLREWWVIVKHAESLESVEVYNKIKSEYEELVRIEERRRNAGCVEPPAG